MSKNIQRLCILRALQYAWLPMPTIVLYYQAHGMSLRDIFLLKSFNSTLALLLEIPTGYFADTMGRRRSIVIGGVFLLLYPLTYALSGTSGTFYLAETFLALGMCFVSGADSALAFDSLEQAGRAEEYGKVEGRLNSIAGFAESAGGLVTGVLASLSLVYPFWGQFFLYLAFIAVAWSIVEPTVDRPPRMRAGFRDMVRSARFGFFEHSTVRRLGALSAVLGASSFLTVWFAQPYLELLDIPVVWFGIVWSALHAVLGIASLATAPLMNRFGVHRTTFFCTAAIIIAFGILSLPPGWWGLIGIALIYSARGIRVPVLRSWVSTLVPAERRATLLSVMSFCFRLAFVLYGPLFGFIGDRFGLGASLLLTMVVVASISLPLLVSLEERAT